MTGKQREIRGYWIGGLLAAGLSVLAFTPAIMGLFSTTTNIWIIFLAGIAQIIVQMRFFLHIDLSRQKREDLLLILFSILLLTILVAGTIWILRDLSARMIMMH